VSYPSTKQITPASAPGSDAVGDKKTDIRSPIEQFRTAPKKPLSVTDLVSPAWCELQYWYALKIRGKPKQTKAMQEGSVVHKELENQVYTTVKVEIATKEDGWALRIWNVIQGLHTLQEIGYTRELEVWGTVDGLVVNGVIDEVSFTCPDPELESQLENRKESAKDKLPTDQTTISDFFKASHSISLTDAIGSKKRGLAKKVYICDVKTRSNRRLPTGAAFHPTKMQLMMYHHLLSNLVTNQVDIEVLLNRHELDGDKPFSDSFIARIGSLNEGIPFYSLPSTMADPGPPSSQDSISILLEHNSLRKLWSFMIKTYQSLLPAGKDSISSVLRAEYRSRDDGEVLGSSTLAMDESVLNVYLDHELKWWKGEREPQGVVIEEAYKCKTCDYADICDWRRERVAEATEKARANKKAIGEVKKWEV
jgi:exonuclease V